MQPTSLLSRTRGSGVAPGLAQPGRRQQHACSSSRFSSSSSASSGGSRSSRPGCPPPPHVQRLASRHRALSGIHDPETPPYALLSTPVYSLSSADADGGSVTLNLVTYASAIALKPVRKFALGLFTPSLSYANVKATRRAVLQILQQRHAPLTQLLGKTSGRDVDKVAELQRAGFATAVEYGLPVLADAVGVMELQVVSDFIPAGDHEVVVCDVVSWKTLQQGTSGAPQPLYTAFLREQGLL